MSRTPALRPMSVGDILDEAFSLYRRNFTTLFGIVALINAPLLALSLCTSLLSLPSSPLFPSDFEGRAPLLMLASIASLVEVFIALIGYVVQAGALSFALSEQFFGRKVTIRETYRHALRRWSGLIVAAVILAVINAILLVCSVFLCLIPALFVLLPLDVRWLFTAQAIILEDLDGVAGMRRS